MRRRVRPPVFLVLLTAIVSWLGLGTPTAANASESFEHVHALAFDADGHALWVAAHTGLYRSEDSGRTWVKAALPAQGHGPDVMVVAPHPTDARVVYAGTHEAGILKTTDGGKTWAAVNRGLAGPDIHGLALDPNAPDKLHALVREKGAGLYRTTDGGQKWVRVDDGPAGETKVLASVNIPTGAGTPKDVAAVAVNPKRPREVYAATADGRLFVSRDGGQAWDGVR